MKRLQTVLGSIFCMFLMLSMVNIDAQSNSITINANLTILNPKDYWDVGEEIIFDASNTDGFYSSLAYLFHDGSEPVITSSPNITHAFPIEGKYLVTLIAIGTGGISSQATISVEIKNTQPEVTLPPLPDAIEDEPVNLTAYVVDTTNDIDTLQFNWILGDGNTKAGSNITYAWHYAGTYTVTLQVIDDQGAINYDTTEITINNIPPVADFNINIEPAFADTLIFYEDEELAFDASATVDSESDYAKLKYYWDFGDGTVGRGRALHHSYHESGIYEIELLVVDDDGARNSIEKSIEILNTNPTVYLLSPDVVLNEGESYVFSTVSQDTETDYARLQYLWSFGASGWQASNSWADDWSGEVSVQVEDPEGATASDNLHVDVLNVPPTLQIDSA
ncbi:MAG: PKD domain-containing protein, partial [Candidatus Helarchaeota archaeon]